VGDESLLAVDLGLRTGLALYGRDGRLVWYRSQHFAGRQTLRSGVAGLLEEHRGVSRIVMEGGGPLATIWQRQAAVRKIPTLLIHAETWRRSFFGDEYIADRRGAKRDAGVMARRVIDWSGADKPTSLRHDAAEAILVGLWGVLELRWLEGLPVQAR
jgi:hypothetical protein